MKARTFIALILDIVSGISGIAGAVVPGIQSIKTIIDMFRGSKDPQLQHLAATLEAVSKVDSETIITDEMWAVLKAATLPPAPPIEDL